MTQRHWCFTWYPNENLDGEEAEPDVIDPSEWPHIRYAIWQLEQCPDTGRIHYQGKFQDTLFGSNLIVYSCFLKVTFNLHSPSGLQAYNHYLKFLEHIGNHVEELQSKLATIVENPNPESTDLGSTALL